jgi:hypothetical protein
LHQAISAEAPDPIENQKWMESFLANLVGATHGEITQKEFDQASVRPVRNPSAVIDSRDDVWIFTETFYFYAWRMVEILNGQGPREFPNLGTLKAKPINIARNQLIEHPEDVKYDPDFNQGLLVVSQGPVLRPQGAVLHLDSGRLDPRPDAKDQGLFIAAEKLRDELERRFSRAISEARLKALPA